ncbi:MULTISPECIES: glucoamylase family protein [unclassified Variovorax]|uniref:glucoamylase family protein n=1 Tax=unclassified Variovorax TaxID=663243 RepID=UPI001E33416B|nr:MULTISPECIES: glucoamylase family protein [unclassified Variovorax]
MLDRLQRAAFDYFLKTSNPQNGLVADTTRDGSPASIAVVGFALSAYPVAVERGWIERSDAVQRTLQALRFFWNSDQTGRCDRLPRLLLSLSRHGERCPGVAVGTVADRHALLLAGMLTAAAYFTATTPAEVELRELADALYRRVDWRWAQRDGSAVAHGWKPESGFLSYGWEGYSEAILLYVLGLGSPTHPLTEESFRAWTVTYQWENLYGHDYLYAGPLFIHQFSHAWIDFRGIQDRFMREKACDYFENSRRATYVQREYATRNPRSFIGYFEDCWGLSAGDGPTVDARLVAGRRQAFYGYAARGVPYGPDDGTIAGSSTLASLVFAPEIALPAVRKLYAHRTRGEGESVRASGFNATVSDPGPGGWISKGEFGLDQGMIVLMIENFRSGLLWRLGRSCTYIQAGLRRAGFRGGWL